MLQIENPSPWLVILPLLIAPLLLTWLGTTRATPKPIRQQMRRNRRTVVKAAHAPLVAAAVASVITPTVQLRCLMCGEVFDIPAEQSELMRGVVGWQIVAACIECRWPAASRSLTREYAEKALAMNVQGELHP